MTRNKLTKIITTNAESVKNGFALSVNVEDLVEDILEEISSKTKRFKPPTIEEISNYKLEINSIVNSHKFFDFYESKNWYVGKNKMKCWKAAFRNWETTEKERNGKHQHTTSQNNTNTTTGTKQYSSGKVGARTILARIYSEKIKSNLQSKD